MQTYAQLLQDELSHAWERLVADHEALPIIRHQIQQIERDISHLQRGGETA